MGRPGLQVILLACLVAVHASAVPAFYQSPATRVFNVPLATKYVTTEVTTVHEKETMVLIGQFCQQAKGKAINVSVILNNNPSWNTTFGVMRYFVVDDPIKEISGALCTNVVNNKAGPNCVVPSWPSDNDIYIKATAGQSEAISFTLDAEVFSKTSKEAARIRAVASKHSPKLFSTPAIRASQAPVYLTEIVTSTEQGELVYHGTMLLKFAFCPTPATGTQYIVRVATTATDGKSSYAQYLCDELPCVVDGINVVADNGRQLPSNTVSTTPGPWKNLYALIVGWGGVYDPARKNYFGHFVFNAVQVEVQ